MKLKYLSERHEKTLRRDIPGNTKNYNRQEYEFFEEASVYKEYGKESAIEIDELPPLAHGGPETDYENSRVLHNSLKHLTPVQASSPGLWTYMTHGPYLTYMRKRWSGRSENQIKERYFVQTASSRWLMRNGVARLWWFGHLTYDAARVVNPYELTRALVLYQDVQAGLLERSFGRSPFIRRTVLEFVIRNEERWRGSETGAKKAIQQALKNVSATGGFSVLDVCQPQRLVQELEKVF